MGSSDLSRWFLRVVLPLLVHIFDHILSAFLFFKEPLDCLVSVETILSVQRLMHQQHHRVGVVCRD